MAELAALLAEYTKVRGVTAAVLVGQDGLLLHGEMAADAVDFDLEAIGALAASSLPAAHDTVAEIGPGRLVQAVLEHEGGVVVIEPIEDVAVLVIAAAAAANLGLLRVTTRRLRRELEQVLVAP